MSEQASAADLIEQAKIANTSQELDEIEAQANGRTTVINAVHDRRDQLAAQLGQQPDQQAEQPSEDTQESLQTEAQTEVIDNTGKSAPPVQGSLGTSPGGSLDDPQAHLQTQTAEQKDPPLGPYPDPPRGPYPDPVRKQPQEPAVYDRDHPDPDREPGTADRGSEPASSTDPAESEHAG